MKPYLVLVVDDDLDTRELYTLVFEVAGFRVAAADSVGQALDAARCLHPDVILTDWRLGDGDGLTLCRELRRHGPTRLLPVVAATGMTLSLEVRAQARQAGCEAFLIKPLDVEELVRTTSAAIQVRQARMLRAAAALVRREAARASRTTSNASASSRASASGLIAASRAAVRGSVALIIADDAGHYVAANERAAELTGYATSVLETMSVSDLTPDPQAAAAHDLWHQFMESGAQEGVYLVKRSDGEAVPLRYVAFANIAPGLHLSALSPAAV
ncbi:MAG: response regulator [Acidobacteriota bacterium]